MIQKMKTLTSYAQASSIRLDVAELLRPPRRILPSIAAAENMMVVGGDGTNRPWSPETTPYIITPMDCMGSRAYDAVIFVGPARTGKTNALIDGYIAYKLMCDPADGLIVQISEEKAREFSKKRIGRMLDHSPRLTEKLSPRGHDNNVHDRTFKAGNYLGIKWPSKNVLASSDYQFVLLTDYDRMDADVDGEGSAFILANKRTQTFGSTGMTLAESSPGGEITDLDWVRPDDCPHMAPPAAGILDLYNQGDRQRWYWQCPHCSEWFQPIKENFNLVSKRPFCPHCGVEMEPNQKRTLNINGRWVPEGCWLDTEGTLHGTRRNTRVASFWMEGPAAAFQTWHSLADKLKAAEDTYENTGSQENLKSIINTDWGRPYEFRRSSVQRSSETLMERREEVERRTVPSGVRFLTAAVDVQGGKNRRFVVQIHGWGPNRETWLIDRFNIKEDCGPDNDQPARQINPASRPEDWDLLTRDVLMRTYKLADGSGRRMPVITMAVDTGGEKGDDGESVTSQAYEWYRRLVKDGVAGRVMLVKGSSTTMQTRIRKTYPDNSKRKDRNSNAAGDIPLYILNTNNLKDTIAGMIDREDPGAGYLHIPNWLGRWWFDELTYEERDPLNGKWQKPGKKANEAFDLCVYNLAIFIELKAEVINWDEPPAWAADWDENPLIIPAETNPREYLARQLSRRSKPRKRVYKSKL